MTFTNLMWMYKNEYTLVYRKNDKDKWKPWNPECKFNKKYQYRCK